MTTCLAENGHATACQLFPPFLIASPLFGNRWMCDSSRGIKGFAPLPPSPRSWHGARYFIAVVVVIE